jgi:hypothetical protein
MVGAYFHPVMVRRPLLHDNPFLNALAKGFALSIAALLRCVFVSSLTTQSNALT